MPARRVLALTSSLAAVLLVAACTSNGGEPAERLGVGDGAADVVVQEGLTFWSQGDDSLLLDACLPKEPEGALPVMVVVHGGGFDSGDRVDGGSRGLCETIARDGIAAFSIDYHLAPESTYPTQVDDLSNAVKWLRLDQQVSRFGIDPTRIGVIGSSAGAVLAQSVGVLGEGPPDAGTRVQLVVSLSGVSDFDPSSQEISTASPEGTQLILNYLGCSSVTECPVAREASPIDQVDASDPPMLLVNGTRELVPQEQASAMADALESAGVVHELLLVDGDAHGTSLLEPDVRTSVRTFLKENL